MSLKAIQIVRQLSGTTVSEVEAKATPSVVGAGAPVITAYAACQGKGDAGTSYRRPRELGEVIHACDEIATVDGIVKAKNSVGMKMRSEWLLRVWTNAPHTRATQEARDIRMAPYAGVGAMYE
jgi:hypothetical protein